MFIEEKQKINPIKFTPNTQPSLTTTGRKNFIKKLQVNFEVNKAEQSIPPTINNIIESNLNITQNNSPMNINTMNINIFSKNVNCNPQNLINSQNIELGRSNPKNAPGNQSKSETFCRVNSKNLFAEEVPALNDSKCLTTGNKQKFLKSENYNSKDFLGLSLLSANEDKNDKSLKFEMQSNNNAISYMGFGEK
jgi:hypothetical protein